MAPTNTLDLVNLSRDEAQARSELITAHKIDVLLDVSNAQDLDEDTFSVQTTLHFSSARIGASTFVDFINHSVESIELNGQTLDPQTCAGKTRILVPNLAQDNELKITGKAYYSSSGEGMHRYRDPADGNVYLYTQYEPADARRVMACFEQPDMKSEFGFSIIGPRDWLLLSNTTATSTVTLDADRQKVTFARTKPLSSYITTWLAGPYAQFTDQHGGIPLGLYCRASQVENFDAQKLFRWTKLGLDFFENYFDYPYPWGKYDQAFVPEYNLGAMENPGLVTFNDRYIYEPGATPTQWESLATTLMHEMSHMWFGDLVTMCWWDDLWLKESFADYMGTLALVEAVPEFNEAWVGFAVRRKAWAYEQDQLPTTHPIVADIADLEAAKQNFDGITYAKGAATLKQLVAYVGETTFRQACQTYFKRLEWANADLHDFLGILQEISSEDINTWAMQWLQTCGVGTIGFTNAHTLEQTGQDPCSQQSIVRPHQVSIGYFDTTSAPYKRLTIREVQVTGKYGTVPDADSLPDAGLRLINDGDLSYTKIRFDESSLSAALQGLTENPLSNATIFAGLWNLVRDGELPAPRYVDTVLKNLQQLGPSSLFSSALSNLTSALENYVPTIKRPEVSHTILTSLLASLDVLPQEHRMSAAATMIGAARFNPVVDDWLVSYLNAATGSSLYGLHVTEQLRWACATALRHHEHLTDQDLEQLRHERKNTATEVGFATALAAAPTHEAKAAAWDRIFSGTLSNQILTATIVGFNTASEHQLQPYHARYFEELNNIWDGFTIGNATRIVTGLFPTGLSVDFGDESNHPVIQLATNWLKANAEAPHGLRRLVVEQLDHTQRSLRVQGLAT